MEEHIDSTIRRRFSELVNDGEALLAPLKPGVTIPVPGRSAYLSWLLSTVNLLEVSLPNDSRYRREAQRLLPRSDASIWSENVASMHGILKSAAAEWENGLIISLELRFVAMAFGDFLKQATISNEQGRKMEAAVLASAVLEDTVKRLCQKHQIATEGKTLDGLINALKGKPALGKVKAERLRSFAALRNRAFHAEWNAFDKRDLSQMIEGIEEIVESHLASDG